MEWLNILNKECPHCGTEMSYDDMNDQDEEDMDCPECDFHFNGRRFESVLNKFYV